mmetsp:Transcript_1617/g.4910  ORF Transcript_1617/g.4910 Transcript_1617/m.4910 type:complete len:234 (+) Transcript_1617:1625-2326(+)
MTSSPFLATSTSVSHRIEVLFPSASILYWIRAVTCPRDVQTVPGCIILPSSSKNPSSTPCGVTSLSPHLSHIFPKLMSPQKSIQERMASKVVPWMRKEPSGIPLSAGHCWNLPYLIVSEPPLSLSVCARQKDISPILSSFVISTFPFTSSFTNAPVFLQKPTFTCSPPTTSNISACSCTRKLDCSAALGSSIVTSLLTGRENCSHATTCPAGAQDSFLPVLMCTVRKASCPWR